MADIAVQQHFAVFYSPGTFVAETTEKPVSRWDVAEAVALADSITERYGATPYGFRFITRGRAADELDSRQIAASPMHYLDCKVETLEEIEARDLPDESILRSNMRCNGYDRVAVTTKGWKWTQPLQPDDIVIDRATLSTTQGEA